MPKFSNVEASALLRQSPIRIEAFSDYLLGLTFSVIRRTRKPSVPCRVQMVVSALMVVNQSLVAHDMGSKNVDDKIKRDGTGSNQHKGLNQHRGRFTVPSHSLSKQLFGHKRNLILHNVIRRSG